MSVIYEVEHVTTYRYANLPGAGWLVYDPTTRLTKGFDLIARGIARHPGQAIPLAGSWFGDAGDYLGMEVSVAVRKLGATPEFK